jgi:hypothetical protein
LSTIQAKELENRTILKAQARRRYSIAIRWPISLANKKCKNAKVTIMETFPKSFEEKVLFLDKNNLGETENPLNIHVRGENNMSKLYS